MTDTRSLNSEKMANQKVGLTIYRIVVYIVLFFFVYFPSTSFLSIVLVPMLKL